jgi:hypothetical protein
MESTISYGYPYASARIQTGTNCSENKSTPMHVVVRCIRHAELTSCIDHLHTRIGQPQRVRAIFGRINCFKLKLRCLLLHLS